MKEQHQQNLDYCCEYCKRKFSSKSSLKIHIEGKKRIGMEGSGCRKKFELSQTIEHDIKREEELSKNLENCAPSKFNPKDIASCPFCYKMIKKGIAIKALIVRF